MPVEVVKITIGGHEECYLDLKLMCDLVKIRSVYEIR